MSTEKPYYRRYKLSAKFLLRDFRSNSFVDFGDASPPPGGGNHVPTVVARRDKRAAAVINATVGTIVNSAIHDASVLFDPAHKRDRHHLDAHRCLAALAYTDYLDPELHFLKGLVSDAIGQAKPGWAGTFGQNATQWGLINGEKSEGNYDMGQMFQAAIAYAFYDDLEPAARDNLIHNLLGAGKIARINLPEISSSGPLPNDWMLAGNFKYGLIMPITGLGPGPVVKDIGETENHIFAMLTARYLANQLLFQRTRDERFDNRRNRVVPPSSLSWLTPVIPANFTAPSCMALVLQLLHDVLQGDFSEYNAKNYQNETRWALLALSTYSYDHEVRLAARMVLDYLSAKIAVSSSDLRRVLPFRRRNESPKNAHSANIHFPYFIAATNLTASGDDGVMEVALTTGEGADPMLKPFALQTGNTRCCGYGGQPSLPGPQSELVLEVVSDYRVPRPILDLFVNNTSRRFFQRLHRTVIHSQPGGNRNADNMEIYAGSASYLITAGGEPADYAIDPRVSMQSLGAAAFGTAGQVLGGGAGLVGGGLFGWAVGGPVGAITFGVAGLVSGWLFGGGAGLTLGYYVGSFAGWFSDGIPFGSDNDQQKGVAVTTSFIPTAGNESIGIDPVDNASQIIQFSQFSDVRLPAEPGEGVANYGVAPDFACGHDIYLPDWALDPVPLRKDTGVWSFRNFGSPKDEHGVPTKPGFYLAVFRSHDGFAVLEAFDTLLHADARDPRSRLSFNDFKTGVLRRNGGIRLRDDVPQTWVTTNDNVIRFVIWRSHQRKGAQYGAEVLSVDYADSDSPDAQGDAGVDKRHLVNGTILNAEHEAVITIDNPALGTRIRLDLSDPFHPRRTAEDGSIESAGANEEVWTDFDWHDSQEGDACRPFSTLAAAAAAVRDGGTIRMIPSHSAERTPIGNGKRFKLVAPIGGVTIGRT